MMTSDQGWELAIKLHMVRTSLFLEMKLRSVVNDLAYLEHTMPDCELLKEQHLSFRISAKELCKLLEALPSRSFESTRKQTLTSLIKASAPVVQYSALAEARRFTIELNISEMLKMTV